ncbi:riboflavin biosynthesis protein RibD [Chloropicon primus]|uniref:Riboflavin biosynthesis protein PYRD, chloroplastic n=1 Tax=Chloropicon primus TaxID=1764295 RepID=A0A5B8MFZ3_9CHLO|nr:riboflavin biosynthesis protein RibD [Chloropicon primus]UPQ98552.1 riboflavin biosynthesis protein RibD [Chloropicon primus]|eukprot:QDZ19343.1 riboflavin biosynthesis protein RibD [Chloropicon primus]
MVAAGPRARGPRGTTRACQAQASPGGSHEAQMMRKALGLAERARGKTHPNPMVGCVIVRDGQVIGEGFHPAAGQPHAEVFALRAAGNKAEGATAYVTLEPCNHYGRTPPCSLALVTAGVSRVVVGMEDPNPLVSGTGIQTLKDNGIEVVVGVEEEACRELNVDFIERMMQERESGE